MHFWFKKKIKTTYWYEAYNDKRLALKREKELIIKDALVLDIMVEK